MQSGKKEARDQKRNIEVKRWSEPNRTGERKHLADGENIGSSMVLSWRGVTVFCEFWQ